MMHDTVPENVRVSSKSTGRIRSQLLQEKLQEFISERHGLNDWDPILAMADIALTDGVPLRIKVDCLKEISQYIHAKRKAIDVNAGEGTKINFMFVKPSDLDAD
jgi:hypothetical protein